MLTSAVGASAATGGPCRASFRILCRRWPNRNLKSLRRSRDTTLSAAALSWESIVPLGGSMENIKMCFIPRGIIPHYLCQIHASQGDTLSTLPSHIHCMSLQTPDSNPFFCPLARIPILEHVSRCMHVQYHPAWHSFQLLKHN